MTKSKWWILTSVITSSSLIFIDQTILPVALPTIQRIYQIGEVELQWTINAYFLAMAVFVLVGGRLADLIGPKKNFAIGMSLFTLASISCALSLAPWWLILSRGLQGIGAAILIPSSWGIIVKSFPPNQRGMAIGINVSVASVFLIVGPVIGGALTQYVSWRLIFWINVPIAVLGLVLLSIFVPNFPKKEEKFDFWGFFTFCIGFTALTLAVMQVREWGWENPYIWMLLVLAVIFLISFYFISRKVRDPLMDFSLYRNHVFTMSGFNIFATQFTIMVTIFWTIYFQNVMGYSAFAAGAFTMFSCLPVMIGAPLAGTIADKYGVKIPVIAGIILMLFCLTWVSFFSGAETFWIFLPGVLAFGFAVPSILTPSSSVITRAVHVSKMGIASGATNAMRYTGSTFGVAVLGSILSNTQLYTFAKKLKEHSETSSINPKIFEGLLAKTANSVEALSQFSTPTANIIWESLKESSIKAFMIMNASAGILMIVSLFVTLKIKEEK